MKYRWGGLALVVLLSIVSGGWLVRRPASPNGDVYQRARLLENVLSTIGKHYVDPTSEEELYQQATDHLIATLHDPYAELLVGDAYRQYRDQMAGVRRAGDEETSGHREDRVVAGALFQPGEVRVPAVSGVTVLDGGVGYIALHTLSQTASAEVETAVTQLRARGARSLVIDLRANPGGLITQGVRIADLLLDRGDTIAVTRGRTPEHSKIYVDREPQRWPDLPVAVLVNRGTASSAELLASALQDHDRAAVVGTATYGKGVVQTTFRLGEEVALKLTTSRWYAPSGRTIQRPIDADGKASKPSPNNFARFRTSAGRGVPENQGVVPDLVVRPAQLSRADRELLRALGHDLSGYRGLLDQYARSLGDRPRTEEFAVTPKMREEVRALLRQEGTPVSPETFEDASRYADHEIARAIARQRFGEQAELRRRLDADRQLGAAASLLRRSRSAGDAVALASTRR